MPPRLAISKRGATICVVGALLSWAHLQVQFFFLALYPAEHSLSEHVNLKQPLDKHCAVNLFGLPRAFESLVLPSFTKNVIHTNSECDFFVHYYNQTEEAQGRSSAGGVVHADQIRLLTKAVHGVNPTALVEFTVNTPEEFDLLFSNLTDKVHNSKDSLGRYIYFPWRARTYKNPGTVDNILKMWHSIHSVWKLMEEHAQIQRKSYTRVAMLRSDVVYLTPIRIWEKINGERDTRNEVAVIPAFARFPVNDRIIYGPYRAVEEWAAHRFDRLEEHVQWMLQNDPGWGMHSERFINHSILPNIRKLGYTVYEHNTMCFLRARVDESIWVTDCWGKSKSEADSHILETLFGINGTARDPRKVQKEVVTASKAIVEQVVGRACFPGNVTRIRQFVSALNCGRAPS